MTQKIDKQKSRSSHKYKASDIPLTAQAKQDEIDIEIDEEKQTKVH